MCDHPILPTTPWKAPTQVKAAKQRKRPNYRKKRGTCKLKIKTNGWIFDLYARCIKKNTQWTTSCSGQEETESTGWAFPKPSTKLLIVILVPDTLRTRLSRIQSGPQYWNVPSSPDLQTLISLPHSDFRTCEAVILLVGLGSRIEYITFRHRAWI